MVSSLLGSSMGEATDPDPAAAVDGSSDDQVGTASACKLSKNNRKICNEMENSIM